MNSRPSRYFLAAMVRMPARRVSPSDVPPVIARTTQPVADDDFVDYVDPDDTDPRLDLMRRENELLKRRYEALDLEHRELLGRFMRERARTGGILTLERANTEETLKKQCELAAELQNNFKILKQESAAELKRVRTEAAAQLEEFKMEASETAERMKASYETQFQELRHQILETTQENAEMRIQMSSMSRELNQLKDTKARLGASATRFEALRERVSKHEALWDRLVSELTCAIVCGVPERPGITSFGFLCDYPSMCRWVREKGTCPMTRRALRLDDVSPLVRLKNAFAIVREGEALSSLEM
jgi:hypothetical protein